MTKKLSIHQQKAIGAFIPSNTDIDIAVLYTRVYGDPGVLSAREMQQKLAPTFAAVNEKLAKVESVIEPGEKKRTYRLNTNTKG